MRSIIALIATLIVFIVIIITGLNYTGNINVNVETITSTYYSTTTHYTTIVYTSTLTATQKTTILNSTSIVLSATTTGTLTFKTTTTLFLYSNYTITSTTIIEIFPYGNGEPNVVYIHFYSPTADLNTVSIFGKRVLVPSNSIMEFINLNTTSAIVPIVQGDTAFFRYQFTIADPLYLIKIYENWTRLLGAAGVPLSPLDYVTFISSFYTIVPTFKDIALPDDYILPGSTMDYYGLEIMYLDLLVNNNKLVTIIMNPAIHRGFALMNSDAILFGTRTYSNYAAFAIANSLSPEMYYWVFNKYFGVTTVFTTSISIPPVVTPVTSFTLFETIRSGTMTTIVNEVEASGTVFIQYNSSPIMTIIKEGNLYYVLLDNYTVTSTTGVLPFVFTATNYYYVGSTTYAYYMTYSSGLPVIWAGYFYTEGRTVHYEYSAYYYGGNQFLRATGRIIIGG